MGEHRSETNRGDQLQVYDKTFSTEEVWVWDRRARCPRIKTFLHVAVLHCVANNCDHKKAPDPIVSFHVIVEMNELRGRGWQSEV